jgi:deferrochelatase/peroxidase EfeB
MVAVDLSDVQAIVVDLYKCAISRHLLFRFGDSAGARAFVGELASSVTMADRALDATPDPLLNLSITFNGLNALGVDPMLLVHLDAIYKAGPDGLPLGDVPGTRSDPATWWEGQFTTDQLHCIVHLYLRTEEAVEPASAQVRGLASRCRLTELVPRKDGTVLDGRSLGRAKLHFGYTDGISHPDISWDDASDTPTEVNFRNFLLGYSTTEYSSAPETGPAADLVRDSAYGAFRWIYQDVAAFNRFLSTQGPVIYPQLAPANAEELLAAKLLGRWRDGTPLVLSPDRPDPHQATRNDFQYASEDPHGYACPFSAHIRVVNPRDEALDPIVDAVPRVIRRGMPYGPILAGVEDDGNDRGIIGIFLCADIRRQVYTLTGWIKQNDFSPVYDPDRRVQDALAANRAVPGTTSDFTLPDPSHPATIKGLPDFVHTKGTAFVLFPGKATLQALAADGGTRG